MTNDSPAIRAVRDSIRARLDSHQVLVVAIDGVDGVGKTTFADQLAHALRALGCVVHRTSIDDFHFAREHRYRRGRRDPLGYLEDSFDHAAFARNVLDPLEPGGDRLVRLRHHDVATDEFVDEDPVRVEPGEVVLVGGVFLHAPTLRGRWSLSVFLDAPLEVTRERGIARDVAVHRNDPHAARELYEERYGPGQQLYLDRCDPRAAADIVVDAIDPPNARVVAGAHALVVGGTGMLADVTRELTRQQPVTLVARNPERLDGELDHVALDYADTAALRAALEDAIAARGPVTLAVLWVHASAPNAIPTILEVLARTSPGCRVVRVLGSSSADPSRDVDDDPPASIVVQDVILGFHVDDNGSRWLTDDEIVAGVLDAIDSRAPRSIVGTVEPWTARP